MPFPGLKPQSVNCANIHQATLVQQHKSQEEGSAVLIQRGLLYNCGKLLTVSYVA